MTWLKIAIVIGALVGGWAAWYGRGAIDSALDRLAAWKLERVNVREDAKERRIEERASEVRAVIVDTDMGGDRPVSPRLERVYRLAAGEPAAGEPAAGEPPKRLSDPVQ